MKKRIVICILLIFTVVYVCAFSYARKYAKKPVIKYYDAGETVLYDGIEYKLSAEIMTEDELVKRYNIEEEQLASYVYCLPDEKYEYMIVKREKKRVGESVIRYSAESLISKYIIAGEWTDVEEVLNGEDYIPSEELELGEEAVDYRVYITPIGRYCKKIRRSVDKQTFYYEFQDYEGHEYLTRVRVLN